MKSQKLKTKPIKAEPIKEQPPKEKKPAPEIIYTSEDIYNDNIRNLKPKPIIGYSQEQKDIISNSILKDIANGLSTTRACEKNGIDIATLDRWCLKDQFLYSRYVRACERLGVSLFDRVLDEINNMHTVEESIIASKKIEALKWLSGKLNQRFSDRNDVYIQNVNNTLNVATNELSATDRDKLMKSILSKLNGKIDSIDNTKNLLKE